MIKQKWWGQFTPIFWGQFAPVKWGLFQPVKWGLFQRNFQIELVNVLNCSFDKITASIFFLVFKIMEQMCANTKSDLVTGR